MTKGATGICLLAFALMGAVPNASAPPIAQRFLAREDAAPISYRALRRLQASNERRHLSGWLDAIIELDPANGFRYEVVSEGGSEFIRNNVLRPSLARERLAQRSGQRRRAALTLENYTFGEATQSTDGLMLVPIQPRRRAELLVSGQIALTADADLVRVEGRLVKNPSLWTRRVDIVRRYGRLNGVRVALALSSTAQILVVGPSTFTMCVDYELINGEPVLEQEVCESQK